VRIKVLEDTDGDGKYDKATVFSAWIAYPTGVMAWKRGAWYALRRHHLCGGYGRGWQGDVRRCCSAVFGPENQQWEVMDFVGLDGGCMGEQHTDNVIKCIKREGSGIGWAGFSDEAGERDLAGGGRTAVGRVRMIGTGLAMRTACAVAFIRWRSSI